MLLNVYVASVAVWASIALAKDCEFNLITLKQLFDSTGQSAPMANFPAVQFPKDRRIKLYNQIAIDLDLFQKMNDPKITENEILQYKKNVFQVLHDPLFISAPDVYILNWHEHRNGIFSSRTERLAFDFFINQTKNQKLQALAYVAKFRYERSITPFSATKWAGKVPVSY
jgi:hypothetical protein